MSTKTGKQTYGRGKYSYNPSALNANIQFDSLLCDNKPSAAKSSGTIGKWGVVSYTSIRSVSTGSKFSVGKRNNPLKNNAGAPAAKKSAFKPDPFSASPKKNFPAASAPVIQRPKKFFKSRAEPEPLAPLPPRPNPNANQLSPRFTPEKKSPEKKKLPTKVKKGSSKRRKTYSSSDEEIDENDEDDDEDLYHDEESHMEEIVVQQTEVVSTSPIKRDKPPIVLRIFKGNSSHDFKAITVETTVEEEEDEEEEEEEDVPEEEEEKEEEEEPEPIVDPEPYTAPEPYVAPSEALFFEEDEIDDNDDDDEDEFRPGGRVRKGRKVKAGGGKKKTVRAKAHTPPALSNTTAPLPRSTRLRERALRNSGNTQPEVLAETEPLELSEVKEAEETGDVRRSPEHQPRLDAAHDVDPSPSTLVVEPSSPEPGRPGLDEDRQCLLRVLESDNEGEDEEAARDETPPPPAACEPATAGPAEEAPAAAAAEAPAEPAPLKVPPLIISKNFKHVTEAEWASDSDGSADAVDQEPESGGGGQRLDAAAEEEHEAKDAAKSYQTRKGSIFKSRAAASGGSKKRLALYKHKWVDDKDSATNNKDKDGALKSAAAAAAGGDGGETIDGHIASDLKRVTRPASADRFSEEEMDEVTGVTCPKKAKKFYTVVKNVKKVHQLQESGEFQEFNDDVEYILDALRASNPLGTRCLSAITLASKCMAPAFRMHLRAHGTVAKFFRALQDAAKDQSLGMCTATVMFVLSQDRLNMDLDRDCLELMLALLESDASHRDALDDCGLSDAQLRKTRARVRELCGEIQSQGHAKHLNLDNITVGHLAMETLLSLTSKRAGEWFKEELRELGGLEHIILTIVDCCKLVDDTVNAWSPPLLEKIRKVDRCLRILENVTFGNEENKLYLLKYRDGVLGETLCRLYKVCDYEIPLYPTSNMADKDSTGAILRECLLANLKVLINLTHDFSDAPAHSSLLGGRFGVAESSLHILLRVPQHVPEEERFDLCVLALLLLINLVERNVANRAALVRARAPSDTENVFGADPNETAVDALVKLFYARKAQAQLEEKRTDKLLDGEDVARPASDAPQRAHEDFIEETVAILLQKAGRHMEHTFIAAYVAVLLGYLILDNKEHDSKVRAYLPEHNFQDMVFVLEKYVRFMNLTMASTAEGIRGLKATEMIIRAMNQSDQEVSLAREQAKEEVQDPCDGVLDLHISPS